MRKIFHGLLATIIIVCFFTSCGSTKSAAKRITIESGELPPDMATEDFTIIGILHDKKSYDKWVEKDFAAYPGKSVTSTMEEVYKTYRDVKKYRYLMDGVMKSERFSTTDEKGRQSYTTTTTYRYYILDRKTGKTYKRKDDSSFFSKEMIAYLKAIDAVRKK